MNKAGRERRRFARADTHVFLRYRVTSEKELPADNERLAMGLPSRLGLSATFAAMTERLAPTLHRLREQAPDVAEYLELLDRKISHIARVLVLQDIDAGEVPPSRVDISAGGIGFYAATSLSVGTVVEIELVLLPGFTPILAYGRVVHCRHDPGASAGLPYYVGVEFVRIAEADRGRIAQHVLGKKSRPGPGARSGVPN